MAEQNSTDQCLEPPTKRIKVGGICVSCLGVLQEENWQPCCDMVKQVLDKKGSVHYFAPLQAEADLCLNMSHLKTSCGNFYELFCNEKENLNNV